MKDSKIIEKNKNSVVLLEVAIPKEDGKVRRSIRGTGFIVSKDGKFVTCSHVYDKIPEKEREFLRIMVPDKTDKKGITHYKRYRAELLRADKKEDAALLKIKSKNGREFRPVEKIGDPEVVQAGDDVLFLGYPLALEFIMMGFGITMNANRCIVSSVKRRGEDGSLHFFVVDTHINRGSSGSPVFLKSSGEVVAIASGKISAKVPVRDGKHADVPANIGICRPIRRENWGQEQ